MAGPPPHDAHLDEARLRRLIDVGSGLLSELDPEAVLDQVLETARELTGARYAALGILGADRRELERFITRGIDAEAHAAIGDLPRGRGILGVLIDSPRPLRVANVGRHAKSYGFPPGHPPMTSFLGVPVLVRGQVWGNLYLTEKHGGGEFDAVDEESVVILAAWAAVAIENARLYEAAASRRDELEQFARRLEAARTIAVAVGAEMELEHVLELIAKRGRALVEARSLVILLREGADLVVAANAGVTERAIGARVPVEGSTTGQVLESNQVQRIADVGAHLRISAAQLGVGDARTALLAPLVYRGRGLGVLAAFDHGADSAGFSEDDEMTLRAFAASGATAVALAQTVQHERLRHSLDASEAERRRWARELHDETLQGLGGLRVTLSSALRRVEPGEVAELLREGVEQVEREIENLRAIITELRPAALDELGLVPAIEALVARVSAVEGLTIACSVKLPGEGLRLGQELETTAYRLVQEALTNVAKHARAEHARVAVCLAGGRLEIEVGDDGCGFDLHGAGTSGFGLAGMRERVQLSGGELTVTPGSAGTTVRAVIPVSELDETVLQRVSH
ncbi:MAG TPA: GAF domain-containing sensor histidine kinase [Solirubrobacteraceae bacterium]|jgi:signal transduction histidine kinase|nr:GAF domain-containing sensor histidine kinase [Solirubrobacteraceae bacterium]